jgi:hypothetical protein
VWGAATLGAGYFWGQALKDGGRLAIDGVVDGDPQEVLQGAIKLADTALEITDAPQKIADALTTRQTDDGRTYQTYTKTHPATGQVYVGRTSGTGTPFENVAERDRNHHKNAEGFSPADLDRSSTNKDAIRGREQQLIDANGGPRSPKSGNSINSISERNPRRQHYLDAAKKEFGKR